MVNEGLRILVEEAYTFLLKTSLGFVCQRKCLLPTRKNWSMAENGSHESSLSLRNGTM